MVVVVSALLLAGCTGGAAAPITPLPGSGSSTVPPPTAGSTSPTTAPTTGSTAPTTAAPFTPVTDSGLVTGPGVDSTSISLGVIVDPEADRGFTSGLDVWRTSVNSSGGICGRAIELVSGPGGGSDEQAYREIGRRTLGLILLPQNGSRASLDDAVRRDQIPALTPEGRLSDLTAGTGSPVVLGATDDVIAINTAAAWLAAGTLEVGGTLAVLITGGRADSDAVTGLTWWAARNGVTLAVLGPGDPVPAGVTAIYADTSPAAVGDLLRRTAVPGEGGVRSGTGGGPSVETPPSIGATASDAVPSASADPISPTSTAPSAGTRPPSASGGSGSLAVTDASPTGRRRTTANGLSFVASAAPIVATTIDGYLLEDLPADQVDRLQVATVTPAYGARHPVASAVEQAYAQASATPGIRSLEGYATGEAWSRLLEPMCTARTLTRSAAAALLASAGPAATDSLFGPTLPANQVTFGLPASRVSALSVADPSAPTGLRPVSLLESAPGIGAYRDGS